MSEGPGRFLAEVTCPVLVWESDAERSEGQGLTNSGIGRSRPRRGEPMLLELRKGGKAQNAFPLGITVGRTDANDVAVDDVSVSRFHAFFQQVGRDWSLSDADSRNGTWVGAMKLTPRKAVPLNDGARVRFGDVQMTFLLPRGFYNWVERKARS